MEKSNTTKAVVKEKNISLKFKIMQFWNWFCKTRVQLEKLLDEGELSQAGEIISTMLVSFDLPNCCFVGKEPNSSLYSLAISPQGDKLGQFLCKFIIKLAPIELVGKWELLPSIKPRPKEMQNKLVQDITHLQIEDFKIAYSVDNNAQRFNIQIYNADFNPDDNDINLRCSILLLYTVIGENFCEIYVGAIEPVSKLQQLNTEWTQTDVQGFSDLIFNIYKNFKWELRTDPTGVCYGYQLNKLGNQDELREDIVIGYTKIPQLLELSTNMSNSIKEKGGAFIYAYYQNTSILKKEVVTKREETAKKLQQLLDRFELGYVVGAATGLKNSYIDLLIFDKSTFLTVIKNQFNMIDLDVKFENFGSKSKFIQ